MAGRQWLDARRQEVDFYRKLLDGFPHSALVFDVGANDGSKTDIFLGLGARVVAVEPDDENQGVLRDGFLRYRVAPCPVSIVGKALSDKNWNRDDVD